MSVQLTSTTPAKGTANEFLDVRDLRIHFKTEAIELPNGCSNDCRKLLSITLLN